MNFQITRRHYPLLLLLVVSVCILVLSISAAHRVREASRDAAFKAQQKCASQAASAPPCKLYETYSTGPKWWIFFTS